MQKLLIVDQNETILKRLTEQLSNRFIVRICSDARQVLEIYHSFLPDLMVLDLEMKHLDGLSILRALYLSGNKTQVLATTVNSGSDYALQMLQQMGVKYILPRPCTVAAIVSQVHEMAIFAQGRERRIEDDVDRLLMTLGLRSDLAGYECVHEAIVLMARNSKQQITKTVYPDVAAKCGGTDKRVERAIRGVIQDAWNSRDESVWRLFFASGRDGAVRCPSNGYFVSRLAMCLENRKIG